jgi:hypothetical protein
MKSLKKTVIILIIFLIYSTVLTSCASTKPKLIVSHYRYEFNDQTYRIRSVNSEKKEECFNEVIAENFMAVDLNQDRIIDQIVLGEAELSEVQKVYDYGLQLLSQEHKLKERNTQVNQYIEIELCCLYEIKSFRSKNADSFNEFILTENRNKAEPPTTVGIDQNADGTLDVLVKGSKTLEQLQLKYQSMIDNGLAGNKMVKVNGMILVK